MMIKTRRKQRTGYVFSLQLVASRMLQAKWLGFEAEKKRYINSVNKESLSYRIGASIGGGLAIIIKKTPLIKIDWWRFCLS